ncbi:MAG: hypothetical protein RL065_447 [Bacteroidota bacterium]|jgi:antitoxin component YwqK of YwqJK toxin-antitoxin module
MKINLTLLFLTFSSFVFAQKTSSISTSQITPKAVIESKSEKPKLNKNDTTILRDETDTSIAYYKIMNGTTLITQGKLLSGKREGIWRFYYENGSPLKIEEYHLGKRNGMAVSYDRTGFAMTDENYKNDVWDGAIIKYVNGGKVKSMIFYKDGKMDGLKLMNYDDGTGKQEESEWKNGKKNGRTIWYYKKGIKMMEADYTDDILNGEQITYNEKGVMIKKANFVKGKEDGKWFEYDENGNVINTIIYKNGELVKSKSDLKKEKAKTKH